MKEKEAAHREYREAISQGHGAYLMDQDTPVGLNLSISLAYLPRGRKSWCMTWNMKSMVDTGILYAILGLEFNLLLVREGPAV